MAPNRRAKFYAARCESMRKQVLTAAFSILGTAVLLGTALFVLHLRPGQTAAPPPLAALHGLLGIGGLLCLILALRNAPLRPGHGTASFGTISAVLIAVAALLGGGILAMRLVKSPGKRSRAGALIAVHATVAVSGFVILAAYVLV